VFLIYALYKKIPLGYRLGEGIVLGLFLCGIEIFEMVGLQSTTSANTVFLTNLGMLIIPFVAFLMYRKAVKGADIAAILIAILGMYFFGRRYNWF